MTGLVEDLRLALRTLARRPGFSAVIVVTLGLAIGANAAVFSFVDAILLRPLPLAAPERLVRIYSHFASGLDWASVSYPNYRDYERANHVFTALSAEANQAFVVGDSASSELVVGALVSASYFSTLGVRPALGRAFEPADDRVASPVAVIGDGFWKRHFAGDPRALGRSLTLNGTIFKVVGVAPAGFAGPNTGLLAEIWTPLSMQPASLIPALRREVRALDPRVALFDVKPISQQLELPLLPQRMAVGLLAAMGTLALMLALVGLYAATAYALSRRTREIGIRIALGAGHRQLLAVVLRDGMTQCALGVAIGLATALAANRFAASLLYGVNPVEPAILAITAALVTCLALAANLFPALSAIQLDPKQALSAE
jgi:hypothetical protein